MSITPKEKAKELFDQWVYYWGDEGLKTKQILVHNVVAEIVREGGELEYWNEVKRKIYEL